MDTLKYPIGKYVEQPFSEKQKGEWLLDIQALPTQLEYATINLDQEQLNTTYREGGWMLKQVVHHVADSHMNAYIRFKLCLTEDLPSIKPYDEKRWAEMEDSIHLPTNLSLTILHALHARWYEILKHITEEQFQRKVYHPEHKKEMTLWYLLGNYAWHGRHHTAHINATRERMNWK